jgi:hypothetical protein
MKKIEKLLLRLHQNRSKINRWAERDSPSDQFSTSKTINKVSQPTIVTNAGDKRHPDEVAESEGCSMNAAKYSR